MKNILVTLFISTLFACGGTAQESHKGHQVLGPSEFQKELAKVENPQLIDVRTPGEFAGGTIEGALNYDFLDGSFEKHIPNLDKEKTVFVFCAAGGRSGKAASMLKEQGFSSVVDLKGGYGAWSSSK